MDMLTTMQNETGIAARGFLSYVRLDNDDYIGVVDHLKKALEGRFHAATGRRLEIFVDRDSIGWGDDWRTSIRESVQSATFFIPVVTMRYFESEACREELLAFHEYAKELGVEALILPIVLDGADQISADDPREDVQLIERLNYKNVQSAWLSGYESPDWLRAIHGMVQQLKLKLDQAEATLSSREVATASSSESETTQAAGAGAVDTEAADVMALGEDIEALTASTARVQAAFESFGSAASKINELNLSNVPAAQRQALMVRVAHDLATPATELAASGAEMEKRVLATDARLRAVADELRTIDADMARIQLDQLKGGFSGLTELSTVVGQMNQFVQILRFAAVTNVTMRKSLQPAIAGLQSISNSIDTVQSWNSI